MLSLHRSQPHFDFHYGTSPMATDVYGHGLSRRKRKAESQDNERLSKRLSLLNLERNGQKLYIPVERETVPVTTGNQQKRASGGRDEFMQVDDTKHKVYIHNIDDELSSSESEAEEGKIVFLPDIERHLRANRIPAIVKANPEGELAGTNLAEMQLVLYNVPTSLTVEPEKDSVRKAIIEARQRAREKQKAECMQEKEVDMNDQPFPTAHQWTLATTQPVDGIPEADDPDAMDLS